MPLTSGFLILRQSSHLPDRYTLSRRFDTIPSRPIAHACSNILGPAVPSRCSESTMPSPAPRRSSASARRRYSQGSERRSVPSISSTSNT
jgi:hypothetical protein